jgi:hypothetical protein
MPTENRQLALIAFGARSGNPPHSEIKAAKLAGEVAPLPGWKNVQKRRLSGMRNPATNQSWRKVEQFRLYRLDVRRISKLACRRAKRVEVRRKILWRLPSFDLADPFDFPEH